MSESRKTIQQRADAKRAGTRARAWTCLVYPDSAPDDWQDIIREQLIECLISPLHDKDVWTDADELENPEHKAGTPKKAHWHVVLSFKNPATSEKAQEIFATVNGVGCKKVKDFKQMARYLCHLDQPQKHRYAMDDVVSIGAIDYPSLVISGADEDELLDEIFDFINVNGVRRFCDFIDLVRYQKPEWRRIVYRQFHSLINSYISDRRQDEMESFYYQKPKKHHENTTDDNENTTDDNEICCPECGSNELAKDGKTQAGSGRWRCKACGKRFA